jgi:peptidoglycan/xylan/chitin deacetylase (PgdA/CDA1 family)
MTLFKSSLLILCLIALFTPFTSSYALVVLQYHHVSESTPNSTSLSPDQFFEHMQLIEALQFEVVDLETATLALLNKNTNTLQDNTTKQVAITFDDAYDSIISNAHPELKRRNWPYTVFVNTKAVKQGHNGLMSWEQLQTLIDDGVTIANHSSTHAHLPSIPESMTLDQWLDLEVLSAQKELEKRLTKVSTMFAYPYGEFTLEMLPWFKKHGILAFGQQSGPIGPLSHPQALSRFPAAGIYANPETLETKMLSLALPLSSTNLQEPVITPENNPPKLVIDLIAADYDPKRIQCFASQQGAIETKVEKKGDKIILTAQASKPLTGARARYNCTAPSAQFGRYYWYSQPWKMGLSSDDNEGY